MYIIFLPYMICVDHAIYKSKFRQTKLICFIRVARMLSLIKNEKIINYHVSNRITSLTSYVIQDLKNLLLILFQNLVFGMKRSSIFISWAFS